MSFLSRSDQLRLVGILTAPEEIFSPHGILALYEPDYVSQRSQAGNLHFHDVVVFKELPWTLECTHAGRSPRHYNSICGDSSAYKNRWIYPFVSSALRNICISLISEKEEFRPCDIQLRILPGSQIMSVSRSQFCFTFPLIRVTSWAVFFTSCQIEG